MNNFYLSFINFYNSNISEIHFLFWCLISLIFLYLIFLSLSKKTTSNKQEIGASILASISFVFFIPMLVLNWLSFNYVTLPENSCVIRKSLEDKDGIRTYQWIMSNTFKELELHQAGMVMAKKVNASNYEDLVKTEKKLLKEIEDYQNKLSKLRGKPIQTEFLVLGQVGKQIYTILSAETHNVYPDFKLESTPLLNITNDLGSSKPKYTYYVNQKCSQKITNLAKDLNLLASSREK